MAFTNGSLPKDASGLPSQGVYVPGIGTTAQQGTTTLVDGAGQPYAIPVFTTSNSGFSYVDGLKATYAASGVGLAVANAATDIVTLTGSATKTIRITKVEFTGTVASTAGTLAVVFAVRSAADTTGTSTTTAAVPYDSTSAAATGVVKAYTANPGGLGTLVANVETIKVFCVAAAATAGGDRAVVHFGLRPAQAIVLRGTTQIFAINLGASTLLNGGSVDYAIEWTEE